MNMASDHHFGSTCTLHIQLFTNIAIVVTILLAELGMELVFYGFENENLNDMNFYRIKSKQPNCKTCGKPLKEWDPFANEHEHNECASHRIADSILEGVKRDLKALNE